MDKRTFWIVIGLMGIALIGLSCLQGYWIRSALELNEQEFDNRVIAALNEVARRLECAGFSLVGTSGTAAFLRDRGIACETVKKVREGSPHCVDLIRAGEVAAVINTCGTPQAVRESFAIRRAALETAIPYFTTMAAAAAAVEGIEQIGGVTRVNALQDLHSGRWD